MIDLLWTIILVLLIFWVLGVVTSIGGHFIHLILVVVVILAAYNFVTGRRPVL